MLSEERKHLIEEACGVFGISGNSEAANLTYLGLHALQHRGQESAGIASLDHSGVLRIQRKIGLVSEGFTEEVIETLPGNVAIGHVRYSTTGESSIRNAQPIYASTKFGQIALAHNGNLTNAEFLRKKLEQEGSIFGTSTDTEVIAHLVARSRAKDIQGALIEALAQLEGAYSLVCLTKDFMAAVRDPRGVRPLVCGRLGEARVVASEQTAFQLIGARFDREIAPGEMLIAHKDGSEKWLKPFNAQRPTPCIFELVYFARPDNEVFGRNVYETRKQMGRILAQQSGVEADLVIAVPDSGMPASLGYAEESGIRFEIGLVRSHYIGRTFIEPSNSIRHFGVKLKLAPVNSVIRGKRVIVVDDSIVRGTTCRKIIKMVREAGAKEVHFRVASPPTTHPCFYGIDTPERSQLIASSHSTEEIRKYITADTLAYLSLDGLRQAVRAEVTDGESNFCDACFTGRYPIPVGSRQT
ncbi:MAG: amidophosphoribosyltransferase [Bradymonadaceae bacterium]|nr:amidophosphoribosyltransferase [Lujinxingiaceae bacterium]